MKKLIGNTDLEDALQRLDRLTQEEARMANAELLRISNIVKDGVVRVDEGLQGVGRDVQDVNDNVEGVRDKVEEVDRRVQDVGEGVQDVRKTVQGVGDGVQGVQEMVQDVDDKVDQVNRKPTLNAIALSLQSSQIFIGKQLRECLRSWLSPADPSTNHNLACDARHEGTAQWFFRGTIFNHWKSTGPFLWVHGKRVFILSFSMTSVLTISNPTAGSGKSVLWFVLPVTFRFVKLT